MAAADRKRVDMDQRAIGKDADRGRATAHINADAAQIHLILFQGREGR